nr:MAG TPA: hypothetical protein [Caudoviricetes sp.]
MHKNVPCGTQPLGRGAIIFHLIFTKLSYSFHKGTL